jgi:hypothetical protein
MSLVNGKSANEWIDRHKPENGWFRVYYEDSLEHETTTMTPGKQLRWEWKYKDGKRADGVSKGWYPKGNIKQTQTQKTPISRRTQKTKTTKRVENLETKKKKPQSNEKRRQEKKKN